MLKNFILYFLFILIINYIITSIFSYNKTIYIILFAAVVFIFTAMFMLYLGFEFLALSFFITYVGGIVIMFLFLILVLEVGKENSQKSTDYLSKNNIYIPIIASILTVVFSILFIYLYNPLEFNDIRFNIKHTRYYHSFGDFAWNERIFCEYEQEVFNGYQGHHYRVDTYEAYGFPGMENGESLYVYFSDAYILGIYIYLHHNVYLLAIAFFLFLATIVACSISLAKVRVDEKFRTLDEKKNL